MIHDQTHKKKVSSYFFNFLKIGFGAFLAAFAIEIFLIPNQLIDGGIVGVAMICGNLTKTSYIPAFLLLFNLPFIYLAYRSIGKVFLTHMAGAVIIFASWLVFIEHQFHFEFHGDMIEVVVIGGAILGIGIGIIIKAGGGLDGTEILGILLNRRLGFTVGQVVLFCNIFIFIIAGLVFRDWHPPILSLITFMVATKVMDAVIVGLDETKSVLIFSSKPKELSKEIMDKLGLGLTIMYGRGGFSGEEKEIIYVITERLQLAELKELIYQIDPQAFVAIENLYEIASGSQSPNIRPRKRRIDVIMSRMLKMKS